MLNNKNNGFTLIELIVTIAVIAIIASLAMPYYHRFMAEAEAKNITRLLEFHIQKAKSSAAVYRTNVVICSSPDLSSCQSNQWNQGFLVFVDYNKNRQVDTNEPVLSQHQDPLKYGALSWQGTLNSSSVTFQGDSGLPRGSNGSFYYCAHQIAQHQKLVLSMMGQTRVEQPTTC